MKKLDEIPKKNIFEVPDSYFEQLPGIIQSRVATSSKEGFRLSPSWALRLAIPVLILVAGGVFWYRYNQDVRLENSGIASELQSIEPEQLAVFLDERGVSTEELVETSSWSQDDLDELEESVYSSLNDSNQDIEKVIEDYDVL